MLDWSIPGKLAALKRSSTPDLHHRWLVRRDVPDVLAIEAATFASEPWGQTELLWETRRRNVVGMVVEAVRNVGPVVGFIVYELHKHHLHVLNLGVLSVVRRAGIGTAIHERLAGKLHPRRRTCLTIDAPDTTEALVLHQWLKAREWRALACDQKAGTIRFRWELPDTAALVMPAEHYWD